MRGKTTSQLVVPSSLTDKVMTLAHESIMAGHLGILKTIDRIVAEFFWPGICSDVTQFCKSCDICPRTVQKGRVAKVPLGRLPLINTPFLACSSRHCRTNRALLKQQVKIHLNNDGLRETLS